MELSLFPLLTEKKPFIPVEAIVKKQNKKNRGVCNVWVEPPQRGKKPFPLSRQLTTLAQISFKFSTKIPKKKKNFLKGCCVYSPSYLPLLVSRDVFTHEVIWGLGLARYHAVWMELVLSVVQYALHKNHIYRIYGGGHWWARGIQRNKDVVMLFHLKLLPCRWVYYRLPVCVFVMQRLHFKGTKCVFDREKAVATCSKWPEIQIT